MINKQKRLEYTTLKLYKDRFVTKHQLKVMANLDTSRISDLHTLRKVCTQTCEQTEREKSCVGIAFQVLKIWVKIWFHKITTVTKSSPFSIA